MYYTLIVYNHYTCNCCLKARLAKCRKYCNKYGVLPKTQKKKVIQLDYQAVYDEVTNICNKVIQGVKDYRVEVCLKSLQQYAENMKRPVKRERTWVQASRSH